MDPLIGDLWGVIEPDLEPPVEVVDGVELGTFEEVVPDKAKGFFLFICAVTDPLIYA